jgi:hypothetical protein
MKQTIETTAEKLAWLRCAVSLSLPAIERACPEAYCRLTSALEETGPITNLAELAATPNLVELAKTTIENLRSIEHDCALARPQAMGRSHLSDNK